MNEQSLSPWYLEFFNEAYNRIYRPFLSAEKTEQEVSQLIHLLNLAPGSRILDLCCGYGRHALSLARRGYIVTGLDISPVMLQEARQQAEAQQMNVRWQQGDMRQLPFQEEFDAVINMFTSFGYLEDDNADQKVLQEIVKVLVPGGLFLLETVYQPRVLRGTSPHGIIRYDDGLIVLEERHIDLLRSRNEVHISLLEPDGRRSEYQQSMRIYTLTELVRMHEKAGLEIQGYYGDLNGDTLTLDTRLVLLSRKE